MCTVVSEIEVVPSTESIQTLEKNKQSICSERKETEAAILTILLVRTKYTRIQRAFTVFGPLLTEPLLHKRGTFDSCYQ